MGTKVIELGKGTKVYENREQLEARIIEALKDQTKDVKETKNGYLIIPKVRGG